MSPLALAASGIKDSITRWEQVESGIPFEIGDMKITPFSTPHDAVDPLAFTIEANGLKVTTVTDIGYMSALIKDRLAKSDCIVVEANHDVEMLKVGPYPWALKQRILGRHGHLSNDALAEYLANDFDGYARYIFLAHLSRTNNHPEIAKMTAERALKSRAELFEEFNIKLKLTYQNRPSETAEL
jgi:phosphoribosyl 1,2-cyclic phosphodiesterase